MKFKVGDPVWVTCNRKEYSLVGEFAAVVTRVTPGQSLPYFLEIVGAPCPVKGAHWIAIETALRPRKPPDDPKVIRQEVGSWSECPWKPETVRMKDKA